MTKNTTRPFFGETTDRSQAFPDIEEIDITVTQDPWGQYLQEWQRTNRYTKRNMPRYAACANPRCQRGGLDLQQLVLFSPDGDHEYRCNGDEGTPAGRRKGPPCDNRFKVKLVVKRSAKA